MSTYLSVDLDFWNNQFEEVAEDDLEHIFAGAKKLGIPTVAVMNHQQLTPFVNRSGATKLVNIDTHSDLADKYVEYRNCGTWVSYVKWRAKGKYKWVHRLSLFVGECNSGNPIFMDVGPARMNLVDWSEVSHERVKYLPKANSLLTDCCSIGFVLSPSYTNHELQPIFKQMVKKYNIPYLKGTRNEENKLSWATPPKSC